MSLRLCEPDTQHIDTQRHSLVLDDACIASTLASAELDNHRQARTYVSYHHHRASCAGLSILGLIKDDYFCYSACLFLCFTVLDLHVQKPWDQLDPPGFHHRQTLHVLCMCSFIRDVLSRAWRVMPPTGGCNGNSVRLLSDFLLSSERHV